MKKLGWSLICLASFAMLAPLACGTTYTGDLPLVWSGVNKSPSASPAVDQAFATVPLEMGDFTDGRTGNKSKVGTAKDDGTVIQTAGDVRAFWSGRVRIMLESAGARIQSPAAARIDAELLELDCLEDNTYNATVRMRVGVARANASPWSKVYEGTSKRWGRSHSPDNYNEALSNALADATKKVLSDESFAKALTGGAGADASSPQPTPSQPPPTPTQPPPHTL
jgi:hypothetical protein